MKRTFPPTRDISIESLLLFSASNGPTLTLGATDILSTFVTGRVSRLRVASRATIRTRCHSSQSREYHHDYDELCADTIGGPLIDHPYWWDTVPPVSPTPSAQRLDGSRVDVAVVGAGYTGLSAARRLARSGATVVVLERERVGFGASSRNGGQVLTGLKLEPAALVHQYGERRARELFDSSIESMAGLEAVIAEEAIDCEYARTGHLQAAWKPSHFQAFREEQALLARVFRHPVELVGASEQQSELGSVRYHGLMVDERSAALHPAKYVCGLALAATRAGARVITGAAAERLEKLPSGWRVSTAIGDIDARDVLVATNGYTTRVTPALQRRLVPIGSYIIATEPLAASLADRLLPHRRMAFDSKHFLYYFRLTTDRRLLFGGRAEFGSPTPESARRAADILHRGMVDVFPDLAETRVDYAWSGTVAFTRDQLPHAGKIDSLYYAGGYCGHGIAMATALGDAMARRISGEAVTHPLIDDRFPPIPFYSGKPWFLPIVGGYYRMKDWMQ